MPKSSSHCQAATADPHCSPSRLAAPFTPSQIYPGCPRLIKQDEVVFASKATRYGVGPLQLQLSGLGPRLAS